MKIRVGLGKDSHRFLTEEDAEFGIGDAKKPLKLGGVVVPQGVPFKAHSDGDVVYHSVFNAISSALGLHSIGFYFPNNDQKEKNRDSRHYLEYAKKLLTEAEAKIGNLSIVIECKVPRIEPLVLPMRQSLAAVLGINVDQISIIATSGENVTPWGQGVGVEVLSSVLIEMKQ